MKALVTGFEPFGKIKTNPSWEAVKLLSDRISKNVTVRKMLLPVEYERAADLLLQAAEQYRPDVILCVGFAEKRHAVTPEYVAVNIKDSTLPDNCGKVCIYEKIVDEGDAALYTNLPITDVLDAIHFAGVPAAPSFEAGAFVCNNVFYRLMYDIKYGNKKIYGGFIHLPPEKEVSAKDAAHALEAILVMLAQKPMKKK